MAKFVVRGRRSATRRPLRRCSVCARGRRAPDWRAHWPRDRVHREKQSDANFGFNAPQHAALFLSPSHRSRELSSETLSSETAQLRGAKKYFLRKKIRAFFSTASNQLVDRIFSRKFKRHFNTEKNKENRKIRKNWVKKRYFVILKCMKITHEKGKTPKIAAKVDKNEH